MADCIFCKIINREIPGNIVFETDDVIAFEDAHPNAPVHYLVVPKKHITCMNDINEEDIELMGKIQLAIKEVAKITGISESGYRVITNCGDDGGQMVKHIHYHVLGGKHLGCKIVHE
ncbi:MAG: histidine triad nucleotide-binding protein [Clostridia bacterium]|nr:histidine triad nucleotide-binding protein [Clostridia bacterium]